MPKWKIDDWVAIKGTEGKVKLHIVEILEQTCYGGKQILYQGRVFNLYEKTYAQRDQCKWGVGAENNRRFVGSCKASIKASEAFIPSGICR